MSGKLLTFALMTRSEVIHLSLSCQPIATHLECILLTRSFHAWMQAQEMLVHARRILGYSYVFAFYMFGQVMFADEISPARNAINQNLFENQQQQLEHMVCRPLSLAERHPAQMQTAAGRHALNMTFIATYLRMLDSTHTWILPGSSLCIS